MQLRVAEDVQAGIQLCCCYLMAARQRIVHAHTSNKWIAGNMLNDPVATLDWQCEECSIECSLFQSPEHMRWISAREINDASRKIPVVGIAQALKKSRIDEG
jgi:hypothetical protein